MKTLTEWRKEAAKAGLNDYISIEVLADWEAEVVHATEIIASLRTQIKELEGINHDYEAEVLRLEHNVAVLRGDKKGELL